MNVELYNGEVTIRFTEGNHRYKYLEQNAYLEGVTTTLGTVIDKSMALVPWALNMCVNYILENFSFDMSKAELTELLQEAKKAHTRKKEAGADTGTVVHEALERYIKEGVASLSDESGLKPFIAFLEWEAEVNPKYLWSEKILYSKEHNYCGTCDIAFEINGVKYLGDWKTSDPRKEFKNGKYTGRVKAYPGHFLQVAAYDTANYEECGEVFDAYMIVYITKTGELHTFETTDVYSAKTNWLNALHLARWLKKNS